MSLGTGCTCQLFPLFIIYQTGWESGYAILASNYFEVRTVESQQMKKEVVLEFPFSDPKHQLWGNKPATNFLFGADLLISVLTGGVLWP